MCQYFGGKIRLGREISRVICESEISIQGDLNSIYFEPFLGMGGVFKHVAENKERICIGCDLHVDLMMMWKSVQRGWIPPRDVSYDMHQKMKFEKCSALRGFVGFGSSYMGRFFSGYTDTSIKSYNRLRSVSDIIMSKNVILLDDMDYLCHDPFGLTIYCDPPYMESIRSNTLVKGFNGFDNEVFWDTMRIWSKDNLVFISETSCPSDFTEIWRKDVGRNFYKTSGFFSEKTGRVEKLFCHRSIVK